VTKKHNVFLRTHSQVLVVVGALIVFLTFVIKEGLREHWKGTADAIETAEYFYPLLAQSAEIKKELKKVKDQQREGAHPTSDLLHFSLFNIDQEFLADQLNTLDDLELSAANRRILIDVLPGSDALRHDADNIDAQLTNVKRLLHKTDGEIARIIYEEIAKERDHPLNDDQRREEFDKVEPPIGDEVKESFQALTSTGLSSSKLSTNVLAHAQAIRERNARYSVFAWWISAVLFALGWSLGLAGKLYGVAGVAAE
jgi:hypothetical protein